jgi:hypothetical protein
MMPPATLCGASDRSWLCDPCLQPFGIRRMFPRKLRTNPKVSTRSYGLQAFFDLISLASIQYRRKMALRAKGRKRYSDE